MTGGTDRELAALLELRLLPGLGDRRFAALMRRFGTAREALVGAEAEFRALAGDAAAAARGTVGVRQRARAVLDSRPALGVDLLGFGRPGYPGALTVLHDPPAVVFIKGDASILERPAVAVVGSRRATSYGRRTARRLGAELARAGVTVVSGMALGIDGAAHEGALSAGGATVAVLGSGIDVPSPSSNRRLYDEIVGGGGLVLSEFMPGEPPLPHHFPRRNRIIAALSAGIVVVEAARKSGALITVDHGLDLGREVFAVPGPVDHPTSGGAIALLRDGANIATCGADVLDVLGWAVPGGDSRPAAGPGGPPPALDDDHVAVWRALGEGPSGVDALASATGLDPVRALSVLAMLELGGWAERLPGGRFALSGAPGAVGSSR